FVPGNPRLGQACRRVPVAVFGNGWWSSGPSGTHGPWRQHRESGGIGRRTGFRFQRVTPVGVRVPPFAPWSVVFAGGESRHGACDRVTTLKSSTRRRHAGFG